MKQKSRTYLKLAFIPMLVLLVIGISGCEKDVDITNIETSKFSSEKHIQDIPFNSIDQNIQDNVFQVIKNFSKNNVYASKSENTSFGGIVSEKVRKYNLEDGNIVYTFNLAQTNTSYIDFMSIKTNSDGGIASKSVLRHIPDSSWLEKYNKNEITFKDYSGTTKLFDAEGNLKLSAKFSNGLLVNNPNSKKNSTSNKTNCTITNTEYSGLLQNGVYYVYNITYTLSCYEDYDGSVDSGNLGDNDEVISWLPPGEGSSGTTTTETVTCPTGYTVDESGSCIVEVDNIKNETPPSCKSFNFKNITSNWQEASVINIRFNIVLIELIAGVRVKKIIPIEFPQPVKFGMPTQFTNGTIIPSGLAAEIGARSINHAIDDVISKYNNLVVSSTDIVRNHFQERLKFHFQSYSNGGRVNFNDMVSTSTSTEYQTYALIPDNCY